MSKKKVTGLLILDGWGIRAEREFNAIALANTPNWDNLLREYTHIPLLTHGEAVGLPEGQMGNSEVGHLNIGAGRVVYQDISIIDHSIKTGSFYCNEQLVDLISFAKSSNSYLHLVGLLSDGGVHAHLRHLFALLKLCSKLEFNKVKLHLFTDGRDVLPRTAKGYLTKLQVVMQELQIGEIATIAGRYYAMDRDNRWQRIQQAYQVMVRGNEQNFISADEVIEASYTQGLTDEFIVPTSIKAKDGKVGIASDDVIIGFNFRSDRMRQLTTAFIDKTFNKFQRDFIFAESQFATMTEYSEKFNVPIIFPPRQLANVLGKVLSDNNLTQLRIAETEKYPHISFFFNGGKEKQFAGEDRVLVPSPKVATYDLYPQMSVAEVSAKLTEAIASAKYDVFVCNFANPDMVGHTGNLEATIKAVEAVDQALGVVMDAVIANNGNVLITADHGNAEQMFDMESNQVHTAHTTNCVELVLVTQGKHKLAIPESYRASLCDIAPTMLELLNLAKPEQMLGRSLLV